MSIQITKNITEANLITHAGTFHPDDVFSTMFLAKIIDQPLVCRTTKVENTKEGAIIYDIGYTEFDHHGPNALMRNEKIKYCSFGLLWKTFGYKYLNQIKCENQEKLFKAIDENLIMQIDAIDNGLFPKIEADYKLTDLDKIIDLFNKCWDEDCDNDDNFLEAVKIADIIFTRILKKENAKIKAAKLVEQQIPSAKNGILILSEYLPYHDAIFNSENPLAKTIKIVIFPSNRGGYNIKPMTISKESKELVVNFSQEYRGLHDEELINASKIKTARFVHISGFLACAETLEDALLLAQNALNNSKETNKFAENTK